MQSQMKMWSDLFAPIKQVLLGASGARRIIEERQKDISISKVHLHLFTLVYICFQRIKLFANYFLAKYSRYQYSVNLPSRAQNPISGFPTDIRRMGVMQWISEIQVSAGYPKPYIEMTDIPRMENIRRIIDIRISGFWMARMTFLTSPSSLYLGIKLS